MLRSSLFIEGMSSRKTKRLVQKVAVSIYGKTINGASIAINAFQKG
jgi:hypothetical protein